MTTNFVGKVFHCSTCQGVHYDFENTCPQIRAEVEMNRMRVILTRNTKKVKGLRMALRETKQALKWHQQAINTYLVEGRVATDKERERARGAWPDAEVGELKTMCLNQAKLITKLMDQAANRDAEMGWLIAENKILKAAKA